MNKVQEYIFSGAWIILMTLAVSLGQSVGMGMPFLATFPIVLAIAGCCLLAMLLKDITPKSWGFPTFAWAMLIGAGVSIGDTPIANWIEQEASTITFITTTTPLLAFAGLSMVNQITELKSLSWKIAIVAVVAFTSIFFICALIADIVLRLQGAI